MSLQLLQEAFVQQLIQPDKQNHFLEHLTFSGNLSPQQQLAIYQTNMRGALQQTLKQIYPVCHKIVGEKYFKQLARCYINEHPSQEANLNHYGEYFCNFLQVQCKKRNELIDFPYFSDLAQLEWHYHAVYYAAESPIFDLSAFSQLTSTQQANCSFLLAPQLRFMASKYPILTIWNLNQQSETQSQISEAKAENCCLFREQNSLKIVPINDSVYQLLKSIENKETLETISQTTYINSLPELIKLAWVVGFQNHHV